MAVTAGRIDRWARLTAVAVIVGLLVAGWVANHHLMVTTAPVDVQFSNLPAGWHHVVISADNGYRRVLTTGTPDGSFGDGSVPVGVVQIEVEGICTLETVLDRGGMTATVRGQECSI